MFLSYSFFVPRSYLANTRKDNVLAVASVAAAGFLWLYLAHVRDDRWLIFPYTAGYTVHLAILGWTLHVLRDPALGAWKRGLVLLVQCWFLMFAPFVLMGGFSRVALLHYERGVNQTNLSADAPLGADLYSTDPILVKAGQHHVSAAFVRRSEGPYEDLIKPHEWSMAANGNASVGTTTNFGSAKLIKFEVVTEEVK